MIATPPQLAQRLLSLTVRDPEWRDSILGDLHEEFRTIAQRDSVPNARRWYWRQVFTIGGRSLTRLAPRRSTGRSWVVPPETDRPARWYVGLSRDVRHARRTLARRPATSLVIIGTLAVVLAVNSTVFAIVDSLLLRPYRFPAVDRTVLIMSDSLADPLPNRESVAPADFREWRAEAKSITHLSAAEWWDANLSGIDEPQQVPGYKVTADFFDALGAAPVLGRDFTADEETPGQHRRAILGYTLWQRQFAGAATVIGRTIRLDGEPYEVVGIARPGFAIPDGAQVWAPLAYTPEEWNQRQRGFLNVIGQLRETATIEQARAEIETIVERQRRDHPETSATRPVGVTDFTTGMADPGTGPFMLSVQFAALLLMVIACANIANLLLARGSERVHEYAMRLALGAGRARLAWQTLLEGALLAGVAVIAALPLTWALIGLTRASIPPSIVRYIPGWQYLHVNPTLFAITAAAAATATILFAVIPAVFAARSQVSDGLRQGSRAFTATGRRHWLRSALATSQVALTLALLFASVMALSTADRAVDTEFGFDKRNLLIANVVLPERPYADPERRREFIRHVLDRMAVIPAVEHAAMVSNLPYGGGNTVRSFRPEGAVLTENEVRTVDFRRATPNYFEAMRIPLLAGRRFTADDRHDSRAVAIVSRSLAERYWPEQDPIGKRFTIAADGMPIEVVGVVGDVLHDWFLQRRAPTLYRPLAQDAPFAHAFVVRTVGDPDSLAAELRRAVAAADADQPIMALRSMEQHISDRTSGITFVARALGVVALIAFALAVTGLYSLMAFLSARRSQEIGVRIALGAARWQVMRLATAQALHITAIGITIGTVLSLALGRVLESALSAGTTSNPWQLAALIAVLTAVSLAAAWFPARRAASIDPTIALRTE